MSKHYRAEDVQELITACTWRMTLAKERNGEGFVEYDKQIIDVDELRKRLNKLSTIEVSEDAISREWAINKQNEMIKLYTPHKTVEGRGQVYWQIEERKLVAKELEYAPSVVPKRSCYRCGLREDCEDSTERKPKEGEWYRQTTDHFDYWECSECGMGVGLDDIKNYCPNCGAKMKGAEE